MLGHHRNIGRKLRHPNRKPFGRWHGLDADFPQGVAHKAMPVIAVWASSLPAAGARVTGVCTKPGQSSNGIGPVCNTARCEIGIIAVVACATLVFRPGEAGSAITGSKKKAPG
jgi:hypothetical protein